MPSFQAPSLFLLGCGFPDSGSGLYGVEGGSQGIGGPPGPCHHGHHGPNRLLGPIKPRGAGRGAWEVFAGWAVAMRLESDPELFSLNLMIAELLSASAKVTQVNRRSQTFRLEETRERIWSQGCLG